MTPGKGEGRAAGRPSSSRKLAILTAFAVGVICLGAYWWNVAENRAAILVLGLSGQ